MKRLVILGGGESGTGTALLAKQKGFEVFLSEASSLKPKYRDVLTKAEIDFEEGGHTKVKIINADEVIKSPGIPNTAPLVQKLDAMNIPVIDEVEFCVRYTSAKLIAITGTNGKTTTAMLTAHILKKAGLNVKLAGNVGKSFALSLVEGDADYFVLELSSFQLERIRHAKFDIAILLNITPDHLDRYNNRMKDYIRAKFNICKNQTEKDHLIYFADDPNIANQIKKEKPQAQLYTYSLNQQQPHHAYLNENQLIINIKGELKMSIQKLALQGKHNAGNSMAGGIASRILEIRKEIIRDSLSDFQNVEHRLEQVTTICGVDYINDSKATNVNSTWFALESMEKPTTWIVGGVDKGNEYDQLAELVKSRVKNIIALGKDTAKIKAAFGDMVQSYHEAQSMSEAVAIAYNITEKGETVLLSPACASFDLFESYEDRGNQFKSAARSL